MKRPMIFIKGLNQSQLEHLKTLSNYKYIKNFLKITNNTQVYTRSDGTLKIVNNPGIDKDEEDVCSTYEEFLSKWEQFKLWVML